MYWGTYVPNLNRNIFRNVCYINLIISTPKYQTIYTIRFVQVLQSVSRQWHNRWHRRSRRLFEPESVCYFYQVVPFISYSQSSMLLSLQVPPHWITIVRERGQTHKKSRSFFICKRPTLLSIIICNEPGNNHVVFYFDSLPSFLSLKSIVLARFVEGFIWSSLTLPFNLFLHYRRV